MIKIALAIGSWLLAAAAIADPYGATTTRIEWNADTAALEVAIQVLPSQVEAALADPPFVWSDPAADARLDRLVDDALTVAADDEALPLRWFGVEWISHREAWLYVEVPLPGDVAMLTLRQHLFFDLDVTQANAVRLRAGEVQRAFLFTRDSPEWQVDWPLTPAPTRTGEPDQASSASSNSRTRPRR